MAIDFGAGTENLQSGLFEDVTNSAATLITGVQHHIYTVLSVTAWARQLNNATGAFLDLYLVGYDSHGSNASQDIVLARIFLSSQGQTFTWNDKFTFYGYGPSSNSEGARYAQAGVSQSLRATSSDAANIYDITVTYIDQNHA